MKLDQTVKASVVARYVFLPGVIPRLRHLISDGAGSLALLMATVFAAVRLLPANHPYLNPVNRGRFGIHHVIGEAWSHLSFKRENSDQIIIFFALVGGFALLMLQFVFFFAALFIRPAFAGAGGFSGMFETTAPTNDIAFMLLDSVFGVPGLYNSCVSTGGCGVSAPTFTAFPTAFQTALQTLFHYYSLAMLVVGALILLYYVMIVIGETAQTGTPFGRRFDHIWAPLRLVIAIGLLLPLSYGYNGGQYIVLYAAKLGSGFATNAWLNYNTAIQDASGANAGPIGDAAISPTDPSLTGGAPGSDANNVLIARPPTPDVTPVVEFMSLVQACKVAYETLNKDSSGTTMDIEPYLVKGTTFTKISGGAPDWNAALTFYDNRDIVIVFGDDGNKYPDKKYEHQTGRIMPFCGQITIPTKDVDLKGVQTMSEGYYDWIETLFDDNAANGLEAFGIRLGCEWLMPPPNDYDSGVATCSSTPFGAGDKANEDPPDTWKQTQSTAANTYIDTVVTQAYKDMLTSNFAIDADILARGWGGAGIWYNQLSRWNGAFIGAVKTIPIVSRMPMVMESVQKANQAANLNLAPDDTYDLKQAEGHVLDLSPSVAQEDIAAELADVYGYWVKTKSTAKPQEKSQGNVLIDLVHGLFGVDGLYDITQKDYINPMVSLVVIGKSMLDGAMRNLLISIGFTAGANFMAAMQMGALSGFVAGGSAAIGSLAMLLVTLAIGIGVTLYYVLPFMPFLYFYFAVGAWVKTIFEAMVGVPLWALAHLKISGEGLPTEAAISGYYMILEIFLRPILTVFGLLAAMSIFGALVRTLNNIFPLATANLSGFDCKNCATGGGLSNLITDFKRNTLDQFFFTILYTILVYMIGTSSFKMIDQVPNGVLRWMGSGITSFAQIAREDPGKDLGEHATEGTQIVTQQLMPGIGQVAGGTGQLLGGAVGKILGTNSAPAAEVGVSGSKQTPSATATKLSSQTGGGNG